MFNNILVPLDGSLCAQRALEKAIELQKLIGPTATLKIISVHPHQGYMESSISMVRPSTPESIDAALAENAREIVQLAKQFALENGATNVTAHVLRGPTARTIVKFAAERKVDLIILGGRGHGDLDALLLGSISHKVTSLAQCTVMVVRKGTGSPDGPQWAHAGMEP